MVYKHSNVNANLQGMKASEFSTAHLSHTRKKLSRISAPFEKGLDYPRMRCGFRSYKHLKIFVHKAVLSEFFLNLINI